MSSRQAVFNSARHQRSAGRREQRVGGGGFDKYQAAVPIAQASESLKRLNEQLALIDAAAAAKQKGEQ